MSELKENSLWERSSKTDPKYTKKVSVAGKPAFTNIDTYYLIQQATKEFGSYGDGFGIKSMEWSSESFGDTVIQTLDAVFFYKDNEFPIRNSLKFVYMTKQQYLKVDEDCPKKLMTNTIAKALSYIGFGADIFLGKFEDANYVNEMIGTFEMISGQQRQELTQMIQDSQTDLIKFNDNYAINNLSELPIKEFQKARAMLQSKLNKAKLCKL